MNDELIFYALQYINGKYIKKRTNKFFTTNKQIDYELSSSTPDFFTTVDDALILKSELEILMEATFEKKDYPFEASLLEIVQMTVVNDGPVSDI